MPFKLVFLWTDILFWLLVLMMAVVIVMPKPRHIKQAWAYVWQSKLAMVTIVVVMFYIFMTMLDSIHFQRKVNDMYRSDVESVLDVLLSPLDKTIETSYSAPFADRGFVPEAIEQEDGSVVYEKPKLKYVQQFPADKAEAKARDIFIKTLVGLALGLSLSTVLTIIIALAFRIPLLRPNLAKTPQWRAMFITFICTLTLFMTMYYLSRFYHIFGTDKVGQDVFYQSLKSIRTGVLIGTLTTMVLLPFAMVLGTFAGYFRGWIDDIIQYIYTTLSSIPNVLLIVASVLVLEIIINKHPEIFNNIAVRADMRLLALCIILGVTSWTSLCRLLRAETLKLREQDYVQASIALGTSDVKLIGRHIVPNLMHIVFITVALDFSSLVLAEAVLAYIGVGVDPSTFSWGNMINVARLELAREPIVWWSLSAAFVFMFTLVLAANLFADVVQKAFDPRARQLG
jgi:peptide/nickel transport system permease protein